MSLELVKEEIARCQTAIVKRTVSGQQKLPVYVTEVTDTRVIGYQMSMNNSKPFNVKHDGLKFAIGGGSGPTAHAVHRYYFKNVHITK